MPVAARGFRKFFPARVRLPAAFDGLLTFSLGCAFGCRRGSSSVPASVEAESKNRGASRGGFEVISAFKGSGGVGCASVRGACWPRRSLHFGEARLELKFGCNDPEQKHAADDHDRERHGEQHFYDGDRDTPVDVNRLLGAGRIPATRLIDIEATAEASPKAAPCRRPIPLLVPHSASIAWI